MKGPYDDIIGLPHPTSARHPRMPMSDRAAQFSPFAALTGHGAALAEAARLTERRMELDEDARTELDRRQRLLQQLSPRRPQLMVTYFQPDERKEGGKYVTACGELKRIDTSARLLVLTDGTTISLDDIVHLDSPCFSAGPQVC